MNRFFSKQLSVCLRTVLLFGLLNGLLFSCGEGIRLLPFPDEERSDSSLEQLNNQDFFYQKNIHRLNDNLPNYHSKNQKNVDNQSIGNASLPGLFFKVLTNKTVSNCLTESRTFYCSRLLERISQSRAPPLL